MKRSEYQSLTVRGRGGTCHSRSIRNVQGEGSQQGEVGQGGRNEGEQTVSDSTSQVGFQKGGGIWCGRWSITYSNTPTSPVS
jgi:hypothetical protein